MIKRNDYKLPIPKPCPFCGSNARIRDLYDVVNWTDDDEPITKRRFVCECAGVECWVSPVTDAFDTKEESIEAWNRRSKHEPKSEWEHDHEILKAYSDGANGVLEEIRAEIEMYEADCRLQGGTDECEKCNSNVFGSIYRIIDKYKAESEDKG